MSNGPDTSPPGLPQVPVFINAADGGTEIVVIDAAFRKVATGIGRLQLQLAPGLYKARFKAGDRIEDTLFEASGAPVMLQGLPLKFSSPIPLFDTSTNHEYHHFPAKDLAEGPALGGPGAGAEVLVFARDSAHAYGTLTGTPAPWAELRLRSQDRKVLFDLEREGRVDAGAGYAAAKFSVDPGVYYLSQPDRSNPGLILDVPVAACLGWCTRIYLDSRDVGASGTDTGGGPGTANRQTDLPGAAIVMARIAGASELPDDVARLAELARQGLMQGRAAVSDPDIQAMYYGKVEYPMLGLYASHLLLSRTPVDWPLVATIAGNLDRWLVSGHPDVDVLLDACQTRGSTPVVRRSTSLWPPMLAASWDLADTGTAGPDLQELARGPTRQYRIGGSPWICLLIPENRDVSGLDSGPSAEMDLEADPQELLHVASDGFVGGVGSILADEGPGLDEGSAPERTSRAAAVPETPPSLADWKDLAASLRRPNPSHSPFQQALRRRVLDLLKPDPDWPDDPEKLFDVDNLAEQFRIGPATMRAEYRELHADAVRTAQSELVGASR